MKTPWPTKGAKLFCDGGEYYEFAHFGWDSIYTQFSGYKEGYKGSADTLVNQALESKDRAKLDRYVFPILFLYRQYLELELKWIWICYSNSDEENIKKFLVTVNHDLMSLWKKVKPLMLEYTNQKEREDIKATEEYIRQFHNFDKFSITFRYPITKNLNKILTKEHRLNLRVLKQRMEELHNFLCAVNGKLSDIQNFKHDIQNFKQ